MKNVQRLYEDALLQFQDELSCLVAAFYEVWQKNKEMNPDPIVKLKHNIIMPDGSEGTMTKSVIFVATTPEFESIGIGMSPESELIKNDELATDISILKNPIQMFTPDGDFREGLGLQIMSESTIEGEDENGVAVKYGNNSDVTLIDETLNSLVDTYNGSAEPTTQHVKHRLGNINGKKKGALVAGENKLHAIMEIISEISDSLNEFAVHYKNEPSNS